MFSENIINNVLIVIILQVVYGFKCKVQQRESEVDAMTMTVNCFSPPRISVVTSLVTFILIYSMLLVFRDKTYYSDCFFR